MINIQQHACPTADPQVPPPSPVISPCPIQGVVLYESTAGEMKQLATVTGGDFNLESVA